MTPALGVVFPPWYAPELLRPAVAAAEAAGVPELWLWEDCFKKSGLAPAAAALAWTDRLHVAVGLLPVPLRNVALLAMETATLERMFPGRFRPVVGHGVQSWMGQAGARAESPLTLLREYVVALDLLLRGGPVTVSGRYVSLDAVQLDYPPQRPMPVFAGGVGPRTVEMLGGVAGGVLIDTGHSPADLRSALALVDAGAAEAGRAARPEIAVYVYAVRGASARDRLAGYVGGPTGDPDTEKGLAGDAAEVAAGVARYRQAGASTVVLRPPEDEPDIVGFVRWVGEEVGPLVEAQGRPPEVQAPPR
jgi:alkanesulfonate monooxygenase SsuD/methylene tetrahydromethanopterin reductase-like flavin-dependent oxidoreductase (luciferase family)